jgi:virulence-associated protein VagC
VDTAKLFKNGRSQAVRLPKKYSLPGDEVYVKKVDFDRDQGIAKKRGRID